MSSADESSPLLPQAEQAALSVPHEHPIFLRLAHSPWTFVGQKTLAFSRFLFLVYTTATWIATLRRDIKSDEEDDAGLFMFRIDNISLTMQVVYYWITTIWAVQHFRSPRNRPQRESENLFMRAGGRAMSLISIPRTTEWTSSKKFALSAFYTMSVTYPYVVTFLHYFVLGDRHGDHLSGELDHDWIDVSKNGVNCFVSAVEILFLSSVRQIKPFVGHCLAFAITPAGYFAWAKLGQVINGAFPYDQVDPTKNDVMVMVVNIVTSMALSAAAFLVVQGLHEIRDMIAKKAECDRST